MFAKRGKNVNVCAVNTNFEKSWFLQDTNKRISAIIRIYMSAASFYRDSPMLDQL